MTWRTINGIRNEDIYHQLQLLSLHGQSKDALAKTKLGAWEYDIVGTWYKAISSVHFFACHEGKRC